MARTPRVRRDPADLISLDEARAILGLDLASVYRLTREAHLWRYRRTQQGRNVMFLRSDLEKLRQSWAMTVAPPHRAAS